MKPQFQNRSVARAAQVFVRVCGLVGALAIFVWLPAPPCPAIDLPSHWGWGPNIDPNDPDTLCNWQWWTHRQPLPGSPHPHLTHLRCFAPSAGSTLGPLDFEYVDLESPTSYFDFNGTLGAYNDHSVVNDDGMTRLETTLANVTATLLEPLAQVDNGQNADGMITVDMTGHRVLIDGGTFAAMETDVVGGNVLWEDIIDFSTSPLELPIESGTATFDTALTELDVQVNTGMSPAYFGDEEMKLTFDLGFLARRRVLGDYDYDFGNTVADLDILVEAVASGSFDLEFDLNGDALVDFGDIEAWLSIAGAANLPSGNAYLIADANLDGIVDGVDFIAWNNNRFTALAAWSGGDFNADGNVDGTDFIEWNFNKFTAADGVSAVPEPTVPTLLGALGLLGLVANRRRVRGTLRANSATQVMTATRFTL